MLLQSCAVVTCVEPRLCLKPTMGNPAATEALIGKVTPPEEVKAHQQRRSRGA